MKLFIERTGKKSTVKFSGNATLLLHKLQIVPSAVLVVKNGSLVSEDEMLSDKDEIKILSVISGG
jgi:sulfur carrier protein ThiS